MQDTIILEKYVPKSQIEALTEGGGDLLEKIIKRIKCVPPLYSNQKLGMDAPVFLHYFRGNSHWWITELDIETGRGWGYVCIKGMIQFAEVGYIYLSELVNADIPVDFKLKCGNRNIDIPMPMPVELDLSWEEKPLGEIIEEVQERGV